MSGHQTGDSRKALAVRRGPTDPETGGAESAYTGHRSGSALAAQSTPADDREAQEVEALGAALIAAERVRQVAVEGWTAEHDAEHSTGVLLRAAEAYEHSDPSRWPWDWKWWKPKDHLSDLVRAGALYQAAVDRGAGNHSSAVDRCAQQIDAILSSPVLAARDAQRDRAAGEKALREFVEWVATQRAFNGAGDPGQALYDYSLNAALPTWAQEFISDWLGAS